MGVFHVFLNCTNGTKLRKASHLCEVLIQYDLYNWCSVCVTFFRLSVTTAIWLHNVSKSVYAKYCCEYFSFLLFALIDNIHTFHVQMNEFIEEFGLKSGSIFAVLFNPISSTTEEKSCFFIIALRIVTMYRSVFRTHSNSYNGVFLQNS